MNLHIILRTCAVRSVHFPARFIPVTKDELITICLRSLIISLNGARAGNQFLLTVVDDHSDRKTVDEIQSCLAHCLFDREFVPLGGSGNNDSMKFCYAYGKSKNFDAIYFVEDDYLHDACCLGEMIEAYDYFQLKMRKVNPAAEIAVMPVDNRFHYYDNTMFSSPLVMGPRRHWRVNFYSNWTIMLSQRGLRQNWDRWMKFSDYDLNRPETHEDQALVPIFKESIQLFTPVPTLAFHVATESYIPPFSNWQAVWESVQNTWKCYLNEARPTPISWPFFTRDETVR